MTRTGLDPAWVASHALAAAYLDLVRDETAARQVLNHYTETCRAMAEAYEAADRCQTTPEDRDRFAVDGLLDLADALVDLCAEPNPMPDLPLTFVDADTGAVATPDAFTTDEDGRAVVWGTQLTVAAARADTAMCTAMVAQLEGMPWPQAAYRVLCLIKGVGPLLEVHYHVDEGDRRVVEALAGTPQLYLATCEVHGVICAATPQRRTRDEYAARHTADHGHTVARRSM